MYTEDDLLPISGLEHLLYCERQCALIHLEGVWLDNHLTVEGTHLHNRVNNEERELRDGVLIVRSLHMRSLRLGITGIADVVEFHNPGGEPSPKQGIPRGWLPFPVEYKRGRPKKNRCEEVQLCAQALCLEEMLEVRIPQGALFHGKQRRRMVVPFDDELRKLTKETILRFHRLMDEGVSPPAVNDNRCPACSLKDYCLPQATDGKNTVGQYLSRMLR